MRLLNIAEILNAHLTNLNHYKNACLYVHSQMRKRSILYRKYERLDMRIAPHQNGEGSNFTKKHLPVELVYFEEFDRIDDAFYREKQIQGWGRKKKEALIHNKLEDLSELSQCQNETHYKTYKDRVL